jgi:hypothetical protein
MSEEKWDMDADFAELSSLMLDMLEEMFEDSDNIKVLREVTKREN